MLPKFTLLASVASFGALALPALAEETTTTEPEIIIIGSHTPIPMVEMTAAISVIEGPQIAALGNVFAADALRSIPGVSVNRSGPAGSLTQVRLRGSEANHVLVLIDGIEASNPFSGEFSFATLPADGISRIEVLRGEQSALWGSDAIGGVINFITVPAKSGNTLGGFAEYGSF
ncbi:MAG: outer membrane cobalamin receptor protein BtuB, partial [Robiginitomaculum sp.]